MIYIHRDSRFSQRQALNSVRNNDTKKSAGHYESYFLRANHPSKPIAFWFSYTLFVAKIGSHNNPKEPLGELWTMVFEKEKMQ